MSVLAPTGAIIESPPRRPKDLRRFWRILTAVLLPLGPLWVTVARGIMPYWTNDDPTTVVTKALAHPGTLELMTWLGAVFMPVLSLSILGLGFVARRGAPVLATIGAGLTFLAFAGGSMVNPDYIVLIMGREGFDAKTVDSLVGALSEHPAVITGFALFIVGHIVGLILLGIGIGRARLAPWWVAIGLIVSQPVHFLSAVVLPSRALDVIGGWGLTTFCFAWVAMTVLRTPDRQWDLPPVRAELALSPVRTPMEES